MKQEREETVESLEQLMTTSCILAGFTLSGLLAIPSVDKEIFAHIVQLLQGNVERTLIITHYCLFLTTCFLLGTIVPIIVYKGCHYRIPLKKLKRVHFIANFLFSLALAGLVIGVISFGLPNIQGLVIAVLFGSMITLDFLYENLNPWRAKQREQQILLEEESFLKAQQVEVPKTREKANVVEEKAPEVKKENQEKK